MTKKRVIGLEPTTFTLATCEHRTEASPNQELASPPADACTSACTNNAESPHADPDLTTIIDAWPTLPQAIRAGIVAMVRAAKG